MSVFATNILVNYRCQMLVNLDFYVNGAEGEVRNMTKLHA